MRVIVPHVGPIRDEVAFALADTGWPWEPRDVSGSDRSYFDLLSELWAAGDTFCIVEHDIVLHPCALDELEACDADWCGYPHEYMGQIGHWLGCVKFTDRLIARHPDALIRTGVIHGMGYPKRHWYRLDPFLQDVILPSMGEAKCCHPTQIGHLGLGVPPAH